MGENYNETPERKQKQKEKQKSGNVLRFAAGLCQKWAVPPAVGSE